METSMHAVDPFAPNRGHTGFARFFNALLATALFRCWHILLFFTGWATMVSLVTRYVHSLAIQSTLLTVIGTVLGFIVSYRTTSSFERYNEGRRLWSQIILGSRNLARTIWFHVPETYNYPGVDASPEENRARVLLEKKTVINLIEAFAVAVKHYLRSEEGVYYVDLYHLVKYLPSYALPPGMPSAIDLQDPTTPTSPRFRRSGAGVPPEARSITEEEANEEMSLPPPLSVSMAKVNGSSDGNLPFPVTSGGPPASTRKVSHVPSERPPRTPRVRTFNEKGSLVSTDENFLLPARNPPKYHLFDLFPFSLLVRALTKRGHDLKGKKAAKMRAKLRSRTVTHNLPLEISLYLSSYVAALQNRGVVPPPTATTLINSLNQLVDALTGLERILTTPIPFSYQAHLWTVTTLYCLLLPFQIWTTLKWLTIPATTLLSFIFFGFLVAGEEIENPFGYDKNDLNMDHFTHNIIRSELHAITALPAPQVEAWIFSPFNDQVFSGDERVTAEDWVHRGLPSIQNALAHVH